jgi:hypothetical protein
MRHASMLVRAGIASCHEAMSGEAMIGEATLGRVGTAGGAPQGLATIVEPAGLRAGPMTVRWPAGGGRSPSRFTQAGAGAA